jgi:hypothetical protein
MMIARYRVPVLVTPPFVVTTCASSAEAAHHSVELAYPTLPPTCIGVARLERVLYTTTH